MADEQVMLFSCQCNLISKWWQRSADTWTLSYCLTISDGKQESDIQSLGAFSCLFCGCEADLLTIEQGVIAWLDKKVDVKG